MMYVVEFTDDPRSWVFFATFEGAASWAGSYPWAPRPRLNLRKSYC